MKAIQVIFYLDSETDESKSLNCDFTSKIIEAYRMAHNVAQHNWDKHGEKLRAVIYDTLNRFSDVNLSFNQLVKL